MSDGRTETEGEDISSRSRGLWKRLSLFPRWAADSYQHELVGTDTLSLNIHCIAAYVVNER